MSRRLQSCQSPDRNRNREEEEFWDKFQHRHKQVFDEVKEKLQVEGTKSEKEPKIDVCIADEGVCPVTPPDSSQQTKDLPLKRPKSRKREDIDILWKHLWHSRKLLSKVKQGRSYFQLLQEQEEQKNEKRRKKEDRRRADHHDSDMEKGSSGVSLSPWEQSDRRQRQRLRPFTPVHQSLTSDHPQQLSEKHVYRQMCCLCWLLEVLTMEHSGKIGPVASCWDARDPGRSRITPKAVNREKLIQAKWERFISPPKSVRPVIRLSHVTFLSHKSSALSAAFSSVLTTSLPGNTSSCDVTCTSEESECPSAVKSDTEPPVSRYLQKLLDEVHQSVSKELYGSTTDSSSDTDIISFETLRARYNTPDIRVTGKLESHTAKSSECVLASAVFSQQKAAMLEKMKLMYKERVQELSLDLTDTLDRRAQKRWMSGVQRYQSISNMSASRCHSSSVSRVTPNLQAQKTDTQDVPYSTHWLSDLLSSLPAYTHSNKKLVCVLEKLTSYTLEQTLRIRPHVFLRVLNSLQPWELCCPELCVAIELVRENAVGMSTDEYDSWLGDKVDLSQSLKTRR